MCGVDRTQRKERQRTSMVKYWSHRQIRACIGRSVLLCKLVFVQPRQHDYGKLATDSRTLMTSLSPPQGR